MTPAAHENLMGCDPQYVSDFSEQKEAEFQAQMKQMDAAVEAHQRSRMGDAAYDQAKAIEAKQKAEAEQAQLFERSYQQERQRLAKQQQQHVPGGAF